MTMPLRTTERDTETILEGLSELTWISRIDFSDFDFDSIGPLLFENPTNKYLPPPNQSYKELLPEKNDKGEYQYIKGGEQIVIPVEYNPMVEYAFMNFSLSATLPEKSAFELVWAYIDRFMKWVFHTEKTFFNQIQDILKNFDSHYAGMQNRVNELKDQFRGNPAFERLIFLPDAAIYLFRLLGAKEICREYKAELAMALFYLLCPLDLIPEGIIQHPIAFMDDAAVVLYVIEMGLDKKYVSMDLATRHWSGKDTFFDQMNDWHQAVRAVLGEPFIDQLLAYLKKKIHTCR